MKRIGVLILLASQFWAGAQATPPHQSTPPPRRGSSLLPPGSGKPIVQRACAGCHSLDVVTSERGTTAHWTQVVDQMIGRGATLSDPESDTVIKYLSSHFGPIGPMTTPGTPSASSGSSSHSTSASTTGRININTASAQELRSSLGLTQTEAEAIVQYRKKNGKFKTWQDVAAVPEETPNQIESLQDRLAF